MRQVVHDQANGEVRVVDVPRPILEPHGVLVALRSSVLSSGTERAKVELGEKSLLAKARARPDLARKVIEQARKDGLLSTATLVRDRLGMPQPLGYSASGVVIEAGAAARGFQPGQLVAVGGAGYANHAEVVYVPATLCVPVPEAVSAPEAAFATLGAIALHGIRRAELSAGELVVVSGLGLIGQLTTRILLAYGHPVVGVDPSPAARSEVSSLGVDVFDPENPLLPQLGADAVLLCAATASHEPVVEAPTWCRDRGRVVVVGDVGLHLQRPAYYDGEVDLRFSRSYGPGRYDPHYEEKAQDYPIGYVRWTEGRNLGEIVRLLAERRLTVADLVSDTYPLERAPEAFARLAAGPRARALVLEYPNVVAADRPVAFSTQEAREHNEDKARVGVCGAGNFARKVLLPAFERTGRVEWGSIATATGLTARHVGQSRDFRTAVGHAHDVVNDPAVNAVLIATRHDSHADLVQEAVKAGKAVYVEKPLAVTAADLASLEPLEGLNRVTTGFNRRLAPATIEMRDRLSARQGPLVMQIRVNAGRLAQNHWADSSEQGGRIVGELCHFVDLACALADSGVRGVTAWGSGLRSPEVEDTLQVLMDMGDGSSTVISYLANGASSLPKERAELHWDGRSAVIEDFRRWRVYDGARQIKGGSRRQDKGHAALVAAFVRMVTSGAENPVPAHQAIHVTRVTFAVVESLQTGGQVTIESDRW